MIKSHCFEIVSHLRIEGMHQHLIYSHYQMLVLHKENRGADNQILYKWCIYTHIYACVRVHIYI